jgi:hypothetical protein
MGSHTDKGYITNSALCGEPSIHEIAEHDDRIVGAPSNGAMTAIGPSRNLAALQNLVAIGA